MNAFSKYAALALAGIVLTTTPVLADAPKIVTWNINGGQQDKDILAQNANEMRLDVGEFDVLVLQEVISSQQVAAIAEKLGFDHWAISDFSPPIEVTGKWFKSLEVAVISKRPFVKVSEWDTTGNLPNGDPYDPRTSDSTVPTVSLELDLDVNEEERPSRGFLRVDYQNRLSVYAVHWKSSGGDSGDDDLPNALKRENNARGVAMDAGTILATGGSVVIAGDYNIQPIGKHIRVGSNVDEDCKPSLGECVAGGKDGYDDSIKILSDIGNDYRLLTQNTDPTYLPKDYGPGAIDHITVAGPMADDFAIAIKAPNATNDNYFGSDHAPVLTGLTIAENANLKLLSTDEAAMRSRDEKLKRLVKEVRERLDLIEQMASENSQ